MNAALTAKDEPIGNPVQAFPQPGAPRLCL